MNPIITSILDSDTYKFSMQNTVLELYPDVRVSYKFKNRGSHRFNQEFLDELRRQIYYMDDVHLTNDEYIWLKENIPYLKRGYLAYLKNYKFDPNCVTISLDAENNLQLDVQGLWRNTILFEVPLMAIISEIYFKLIDTDWNMDGQEEKAYNKIIKLSSEECDFADFGSRRRRNFKTQNLVLKTFKNIDSVYFKGTSNLYFAKKYGIKAIGTVSHEFIMAISVLESLRHANYYALKKWEEVYQGNLGIALTDTFGTNSFLNDFNLELSKLYSGTRQDSGNPFIFTDKIVAHYKKFNINPMSKFIIFSDGLDVEKAIKIKKYCENKIQCSFGIGTHFSGDFGEQSPPLNMVIKLSSVEQNGVYIPVVKLSDSPTKNMGDKDALRVAHWVFNNEPLDNLENC